MSYANFVIRKHLWPTSVIVILFSWAVVASVIALRAETKTLLIGIDANGTRIIDRSDDPILKTEIVSFIKHFCETLYNFDQNTFDKNLGQASDLMSKELWEKEREKILQLSKRVKAEGLQLSSTVKSIAKSETGYIVVLETREKYRAGEKRRELAVEIELGSVARTEGNWWGVEAVRLEESFRQ